ncbi:MAG: IS30 family transposase [Bacilli bacterium]|nr:IS30 family transposase [Bacilli bacterium]
MNYTQLTEKKKAQINILLEQGLSMRKVAEILKVHHSTISRYKRGIYKKRKINIKEKYEIFIKYLFDHYDRRDCSIEVCIHNFKRRYKGVKCPSMQQVYKWVKENKIFLIRDKLCYKKYKNKGKKRKNNMMEYTKWNMVNKTVLPIRLRPKHIEERKEIGHLEIDSIIGLKNQQESLISIVDRCTRRLWLIKSEYRNEYYTANLIYKYILDNDIHVKSITTDNGLEFKALGITAKKLGVKLYKCDPYCSFQRGTNSLVRRWIPKIFDYKSTFDIELDYK